MLTDSRVYDTILLRINLIKRKMSTERNTYQKQAIYEALHALGHPTATEVYEYVHARHPAISRGTVFRVLGRFAETGRAKRLCLLGSDDRFDATVISHVHARCRICGKIEDVFLPEFERLAGSEMENGFYAERYEAEIDGICRECSATHSLSE